VGTLPAIFISLAFSAFFSGMEIAFVSSNKLRHEVNKNAESTSSKILDLFYRKPNLYISTMLVGNNIALVVYGLQMALLLEPLIQQLITNDILVLLIQSIISTIFILFAGEFIPKTLFKLNPTFTLNFFAIPLYIFFIILYPISKVASFLSTIMLRLLGVKHLKPQVQTLGKIDLDYFIQQSIEHASDKSEMETEVKIFQNALEFSSVKLRDCMIPRNEIVACDTETDLSELRSKFVETGFSKILIYKKNIDDIIGYIHSSELFKMPEDWTQAIHPISIAPENMAANKLMKRMMADKKSLTVIVDEFGGTSGLITLEDLVEEIFGEIEDEHDIKNYEARKINDKEFEISGRMEIDTLNEMFSLDLPESEDFITIAGFILHYYQNLPNLNETILIDKYSFKILKVSATKIELVRMVIVEE